MKLKNIPEYSTLSGGQAVELAATRATNPTQFAFTIPLSQNKDCNFSMAGIKTQVQRYIVEEEKQHGKNLNFPILVSVFCNCIF